MHAQPPAHRSSRLRRGALVVGLLAAVVGSPRDGGATSFRTFGFGPRAVALGGAMTAHADDHTASYYNPAGLARRDGSDFGLGIQYVDFDVSARNPSPIPEGTVRSSDAFPIDDSPGLYGGLRVMIPFQAELEDRFAVGLGFYTGVPEVLNVQIPPAFVPQHTLLNGQTEILNVQAGLAARVLEGLRVGVGATFFADVGGNLEIPTGVRGADGVDNAQTTIDQEVQPVIRGTAGVQLDGACVDDSLAGLSVGLTWRDEFSVPLQIPVTVLLGPIPLNIGVKSELVWTPMQVVLGAAYRSEDWLVAADVSWNGWSDYASPALELALDVAIPVVPIDLKEAVNPSPDTHDTWTPRLGVEWRAFRSSSLDLWLRGGYAFEESPFGSQSGLTNFLDGDRHRLSAGLGVVLSDVPLVKDGRVAIDAAFVYEIYESVTLTKDRPNPLFVADESDLGFPPVTDESGVPISDPGFPTIEGDADVLMFLLGVTTHFGGGP